MHYFAANQTNTFIAVFLYSPTQLCTYTPTQQYTYYPMVKMDLRIYWEYVNKRVH